MPQTIYVFDPTAKDELSRVRGVGRYMQILKENFPSWHYINKLEIRNLKFEIFVNPFFNFLQPPLTLRRIAKKQIAVIHDLIPLKYPSHFPIGIKGKINVFLNKIALKNYDLIITDSNASKKDIREILGKDETKIKVVYPCLPKAFSDSGVPRLRRGPQNDVILASERSERVQNLPKNFCLYVGDATWNKNLVNLARAIKIINVTCVFVGAIFKSPDFKANQDSPLPPWLNHFYEFSRETKNDKRFVFLGFVSDYRLLKLYQQARLNILPSRDEGFGFSYLEAASQKCPSVLSDIPVLREISAGSAIFVNPNDPHEIANAIGEIYFNNDVGKTLGEKAFKQSKQFSPTLFKKQFLKATQ